MRKYQQLALFILALVSVFGLIIYRKQYVELRSTFESFNIFGGSEKPRDCMILNETFKLDDIKYVSFHGWLNLGDNFYIYSAFWKGGGVSKAVGIGPKKVVPIFECHVWHDYRDTIFSNTGVFSFSEIDVTNSSFNLFEFSCDIGTQRIIGSPYMVVFITQNEKRFVPITENPIERQKDRVAMCVYPDYKGDKKVSIIEFIAYHHLIGFTDFIIYDEIHYGLLQKLKIVLASLRWVKSLNVLPWNFPLEINDPCAKAALDLDCIHRTSIDSFVAVLNFEDYIVPRIHKNITQIISTPDSAYLTFGYQTCCTGYQRATYSEKSLPLVLKEINCAPSLEDRLVMINPQQRILKTISLISSVVVNSYRPCTKAERFKSVFDSSSRKFSTELLHSKIILLWNSGSLF